ncbi:MAG: PDDEXK nuclease domain-containing protein [Clostridiales bacterium]|nr:PDDEXK nuclease domain-containing protein [Clostridiales bacterium]
MIINLCIEARVSDWYNISNIFSNFEKQINFSSIKLHQVGAEIRDNNRTEKMHQNGAEIDFPAFFSYVPWRHHVEIVTKCHSVDEALFYIRKTIEEGLSRNALIDYMKADLYHRTGTAITNFTEMLPGIQGTIAQEIVKDTYDLNFITLQSGYNEEDLENALEQNITSFLLELGTGFAFYR